MLARISTEFDCTLEAFWEQIVKPWSLQYVASPILGFRPLVAGAFDGEWIAGQSYAVRLYLFKILPLGRHRIDVVSIDRDANVIVTQESGLLAPVWDHTVRFEPVGLGRLRYSDEIEIGAGWLTGLVWLFAHLFYRWRQIRWKKLLRDRIVGQPG